MNQKSYFEKFSQACESFHRNRELIFGYSGFFSLVVAIISIFFVFFGKLDQQITIVITAVCINNAGLSILCIFLTRRFDLVREQARKSQEIYQVSEKEINHLNEVINKHIYIEGHIAVIFHNIIHSHRDLVNKINTDLVLKKPSLAKREESFRKYLLYFLINIKEIFDLITSDTCNVCIKMILESEKNYDYNVKTYLRDSISYRNRRDIDNDIESYPYYKNTAFDCILGHEHHNFFLSNNLLELEQQGKYRNFNPKWKSNYNACLVVPIRATDRVDYNKNIGFLCVDNMKGGFDEKIAFNILAAFADLVYCLFQAIYLFQETTLRLNEDK